MKGGKQQKNKSIWDQVKNEEKDFFFTHLFKKYRNFQKKLKDITELEELQKTKDLKPEQIQKISTKDQCNEKVKELEGLAQTWVNAKRDAEQQGSLNITIETVILVLDHLSTNSELVNLLAQDHESTHELAKTLAGKFTWLANKKDQPWKGLQLGATQQVIQQVQELPEPVETQVQQEQIKQEEAPIQQQIITQEEQPIQVEPEQQQQIQQPQIVQEQAEQVVEQVKEQQQQPQEQLPQEQKTHDNDNNRRGYKQKYHNNNYEKRQYDNNRPYRGNRQHNNNRDRPYQQEQIWQEKTEQNVKQQQHQQEQQGEDEEYITVEHRQARQQQKPQRGGNRNYENKGKNNRNTYEPKGQRNQQTDDNEAVKE